MNEMNVNTVTGKELRELSRTEPEIAFQFLLDNTKIWNKLAIEDPFDCADVLEEFEPEEAGELLKNLKKQQAVGVFEYLRPRAIIEISKILETTHVESLFKEMVVEDIVYVFEKSTNDESQELLRLLDKETQIDINKRLSWPKDSVGRLMSEEVPTIKTGLTVKNALKELKELHKNIENFFYVYIINPENVLEGVVSFREMVFAQDNELVENVMIANPISIKPTDDQEVAASLIKQYELLALPVVDEENKLIGQATISSALDVLQHEIAEDFSQSFGAGAEETIFTPVQKSIKLRVPWIAINMGLAFIVSFLISQFESTIANDARLAALMPIVALVGGNSGSQSLAIVIRALARNDVSEARVFDVIRKQSTIGMFNGLLIGTMSFLVLSIIGLSNYAAALSISIFANILIGNLFGSSIPLLLRKLGLDPALASNIFLTLITDIAGFAGFLTIALILI